MFFDSFKWFRVLHIFWILILFLVYSWQRFYAGIPLHWTVFLFLYNRFLSFILSYLSTVGMNYWANGLLFKSFPTPAFWRILAVFSSSRLRPLIQGPICQLLACIPEQMESYSESPYLHLYFRSYCLCFLQWFQHFRCHIKVFDILGVDFYAW